MTQKHHVRTVEIHTVTVRCDTCRARSQASAPETLFAQGWLLGEPDLCRICAIVARDAEVRRAENEARARSIAILEAGEPPLVHGRIYTEDDPRKARS